jgi:hypothetical protein
VNTVKVGDYPEEELDLSDDEMWFFFARARIFLLMQLLCCTFLNFVITPIFG